MSRLGFWRGSDTRLRSRLFGANQFLRRYLLGYSGLCRGFLREGFRLARSARIRNSDKRHQSKTSTGLPHQPRRSASTLTPRRTSFEVTVKRRLLSFPLTLATSRTASLDFDAPFFGEAFALLTALAVAATVASASPAIRNLLRSLASLIKTGGRA
ncbi:hypothetical protein [Paraburkholderia hospita]|uniref:hypothetical protein n=1 Tax=Paraburkholderia hospita TaxID=169430 RepID=UPI003F505740